MTADGRLVDCRGEVIVNLEVAGKVLNLPCISVDRMLPDVDVILGTDTLRYLTVLSIAESFSFVRLQMYLILSKE